MDMDILYSVEMDGDGAGRRVPDEFFPRRMSEVV